MGNLLQQIVDLFRRYTLTQRILIIVLFLGIVSSVVALTFWANRPEYKLLYSDLSPQNASKIVDELKSQGVQYKLENNGTTIKVPTKKAEELRLKFSQKGYTGQPVAGYKVFDDSRIGMTTFMQRLNKKRALEGELVKTINKIEGVKNSRVHLTMTEDKLFEKGKKGKASVVLYLKSGVYLDQGQVEGIVSLVANSIEDIKPQNVSVLDSKGDLLSENQDGEGSMASAGGHWNLRQKIERDIRNKVKEMVANVVGKQNVSVEVSANLNTEKIERTKKTVDPENLAVVSEETQTEDRTVNDTLNDEKVNHSKENVITNYETNRTTSHFVSKPGNIERLSVAVLVNGQYKEVTNENGETVKEYQPLPEQQINYIEQLARSAAGYNQNRGDVVEVRNIRFDRAQEKENQKYFQKAERRAMITEIINKALIIIGIIFAYFMLRKLINKAGSAIPALSTSEQQEKRLSKGEGRELIGEGEEEESDVPPEKYITNLSGEAKAKLEAKEQMVEDITDFVEDNPEEAANLVSSWLNNENMEGQEGG